MYLLQLCLWCGQKTGRGSGLNIFKECFASGSALGRVLVVQVMLGVWRDRNEVVIQPLEPPSFFKHFLPIPVVMI